MFTLALHWPELVKLLLVTVTPVATIANIMLANNICDVAHDIQVNRFTLPYYIGSKRAVQLFAALYAASYASILVMAVFRILPVSAISC